MNPCPCGFFGDIYHPCRCSPVQIERYRSRISGPLMDRIDIQIEVPAVQYQELSGERDGERSAVIRRRINLARKTQRERYQGLGISCSAEMNTQMIEEHCRLGTESQDLLRRAMSDLGFSARAYHKILKVARTIADLAGDQEIRLEHLAESLQYRCLDRVRKEM